MHSSDRLPRHHYAVSVTTEDQTVRGYLHFTIHGTSTTCTWHPIHMGSMAAHTP